MREEENDYFKFELFNELLIVIRAVLNNSEVLL